MFAEGKNGFGKGIKNLSDDKKKKNVSFLI